MKFNILKQKKISDADQFRKVYNKFCEFTMIPEEEYIRNLFLAKQVSEIEGAIVECGVWRGGMIAGLASVFGLKKSYYLFDSFEGLPTAEKIDGMAAIQWQSEKYSPLYFDNCKAEMSFAENAMSISLPSTEKVFYVKGWFNKTLNTENFNDNIALLRLDADWYESTMSCLEFFFPKVVSGGLIIIDDYHMWEGCSKAVHDYLSQNNCTERISQFENRTAFILKK
jgi:O-methyltransferase